MNLADRFTASPFIETLGGVLLHFLWQGTLIAILLAIALWAIRARAAALRYTVCCAAMLLMIAAPLLTLALALALPSAPPALPGSAAFPGRLLPYQPLVETLVHSPLGPALPWIVAVWIAGVALLSMRLIGGWRRARSMTRSGVSSVAVAIEERAATLARRLGVTRPVKLLQSSMAHVPCAIGWLKPVILIPAGLITGLTPTQLESLLAHEIAHIRRYDYLFNLFQIAIETILFYHPAVWWTSRQMRQEREHCCDDLAVATCGDALTYARALAELEGFRAAAPRLAVAATGGDLMQRVRRLVAPELRDSGFPSSAIVVIGIAALMLAGIFATQSTHAQNPTDEIADSLFAHLHARDWTVAGEVKRQLDRLYASGDIQPFVSALRTRRDWQSREKAAWILGMVRNLAAIEPLTAGLRDESPAVRHTAAWALGTIGDARAIDALVANLNDANSEARAGAAWALGSIGDSRAVGPLLGVIQEPSSDVRAAAAWSLGMIGDRSAAGALTAALQDTSLAVRKKAEEALTRLR